MKKLLIAFCILGLLTTPALAKRIVIQENLRDASTNTAVSNLKVYPSVGMTTKSTYIGRSVGSNAVLLVTQDAGCSVPIKYSVSADDATWYADPYERTSATVNSGMLNLVTTTTAVTNWVQFAVPLAEKMRLYFKPTTNCNITASLIYQIEQ